MPDRVTKAQAMHEIEDNRLADGVFGVLAVASSNFPHGTYITISADGANHASITIPSHVLRTWIDAGRAALQSVTKP